VCQKLTQGLLAFFVATPAKQLKFLSKSDLGRKLEIFTAESQDPFWKYYYNGLNLDG